MSVKDFSNNTEMYQNLKLTYIPDKENIIFDNDNHTVWIIW